MKLVASSGSSAGGSGSRTTKTRKKEKKNTAAPTNGRQMPVPRISRLRRKHYTTARTFCTTLHHQQIITRFLLSSLRSPRSSGTLKTPSLPTIAPVNQRGTINPARAIAAVVVASSRHVARPRAPRAAPLASSTLESRTGAPSEHSSSSSSLQFSTHSVNRTVLFVYAKGRAPFQ